MNRQTIFLRSLLTLFLWASCLSINTAAQGNSYGYLFAAAGVAEGTGTSHFGGGGEGLFNNGAGIGGEVGYVSANPNFFRGIGILGINGSYHYLSSGSKVKPFVTGGYSGFFRDGYANGVNFGGGVNWWFKKRVGLRVEFRDHILLGNGEASHFLGGRVGLTFR